MWLDEQNKYAYLEPLATIPKYRHMGLATIALTEAMKKTKALGAKYCFGGGGEFYTDIGFDAIMNRELWKKNGRICKEVIRA
jgi:predicted N-acetyltransferase YhbS